MPNIFSFSFTKKELWFIIKALGRMREEEASELLKNIKISYEFQRLNSSENESPSEKLEG